MRDLTRVEVVPVLRYGWLVYSRSPGLGVSTEFRERKSDAVRYAIFEAKSIGATSVRIHKRNGRFQEERTYPRSRDPRRSRG